MNLSKKLLYSALATTMATTAHASDHTNLEEGLPVQVEDAYPTAYLNREFQLMGRYERTSDGKNQYVVEPRLEYGFARNWQARINVPLTLGGGDKRGSGDVGLEAFYNFNTESLSLPAFAVSARATLPTGRDSSGVDTEFKFIATKSLGYAEKLQRVHLNLIYFANASNHADERANRYSAILGYSQRITPDTILVGDFVREQQIERSKTANILEIGLRRQLTPLKTLSFGVGAGIGSDSPNFRATLGYQQSF